MGEEFDGIGGARGVSDGIKALIVPVMFGGRAYVVARGSAISPGKPLSSSIMDDDFTAGGRKWSLVKVEVAMNECMRR